MAFIHKGKLKILGDVFLDDRDPINNNVMFECDELIAPAICELNKRGYKTKYSCQGHYAQIIHNNETKRYETINAAYSCPYILFELEDLPSTPTGWTKFYTPKKLIDKSKLYNKAGTILIESKEMIHEILGYEVRSYVSLYSTDPRTMENDNVFEFYRDILDLMEYLYNWSRTLKRI